MARKFDLAFYKEEYDQLNKSLVPLLMKTIDDEHVVNSLCGNYTLKNENDKFEVLFCNEKIEIRKSYLDKFRIALINNEKIRIFHAGLRLNESPLKIRNFEIYNYLNTTISKPLIDYFNITECGNSLSNDIMFAIFKLLAKDNTDEPIYNYFNELSGIISNQIDFSSKINEDSIIELKSKDFLKPHDKDIVRGLSEDIEKKMENSDYKLYIIGYDEKTKKYEPFTDRFDDSRIDRIKKGLKKTTKLHNLELFKLDYDQYQCIIMLVVKSN